MNLLIIRDARVVDVYNPMVVKAANREGAIGLRFRIAEGQGKNTVFRTAVAWDNLPPQDQATPKSGPNLASYLNKHIGKGASISFVGIEVPRNNNRQGGGGYGGRGGNQSNETEIRIQGSVSIHAHSGEQALTRAIRREIVSNPEGEFAGAMAAFITKANQERTGRPLAVPEAWSHLTEVETAYIQEREAANAAPAREQEEVKAPAETEGEVPQTESEDAPF